MRGLGRTHCRSGLSRSVESFVILLVCIVEDIVI